MSSDESGSIDHEVEEASDMSEDESESEMIDNEAEEDSDMANAEDAVEEDDADEDGETDEEEDSDDDESVEEEDSDNDDDRIEEKKISVKKNGPKSKTNSNTQVDNYAAKNLIEKYKNLKGKQLFVLFPKRLPKDKTELESQVKSINGKIIKVLKPRQKSARFCTVEFDNEKDRNKAMKEMQKVEVEGKKLIVKLPKTEDDEYIKKIAQSRAEKSKKLQEKLKLRKLTKLEAKKKTYTSTIIVQNIPPSAKEVEIKNYFPKAIEFAYTCANNAESTSSATVTLPTPQDATKAFHQKIKIGDNALKMSFAKTKEQVDSEKAKRMLKREQKEQKKQKNKTGSLIKKNQMPLKHKHVDDEQKHTNENKKKKSMVESSDNDSKNAIKTEKNKKNQKQLKRKNADDSEKEESPNKKKKTMPVVKQSPEKKKVDDKKTFMKKGKQNLNGQAISPQKNSTKTDTSKKVFVPKKEAKADNKTTNAGVKKNKGKLNGKMNNKKFKAGP